MSSTNFFLQKMIIIIKTKYVFPIMDYKAKQLVFNYSYLCYYKGTDFIYSNIYTISMR